MCSVLVWGNVRWYDEERGHRKATAHRVPCVDVLHVILGRARLRAIRFCPRTGAGTACAAYVVPTHRVWPVVIRPNPHTVIAPAHRHEKPTAPESDRAICAHRIRTDLPGTIG